MPISDDEFEPQSSTANTSNGLSKAEQRRSNKPIMEKRRRARINHCLNELKTLILEAMKKDPARHSKLEKADILAMTVKHLQNVQRQQLAVAVATDPTVLHKFKCGFSECANEVSRYINRIEGVEHVVRQRLLSHLSNCVSGLQQLTPMSFSAITNPVGMPTNFALPNPYQTTINNNGVPSVLPQMPFPAGDVNNNHSRLMSGLQLIPSRLPTGELALLVPGSSQINTNIPFFPPPNQQPTPSLPPPVSTVTNSNAAVINNRSHPSAFTAVHRSQSPPTSNITSPSSPTSSNGSLSNVSSTVSTSSYPSPSSPATPELRFPQTIKPNNSVFQFPDMPAVPKIGLAKPWRSESLKRPSSTITSDIPVIVKPTCTVRGSPVNNNSDVNDLNFSDKDPIDFSIKRIQNDNNMWHLKRFSEESTDEDYEPLCKEATLTYSSKERELTTPRVVKVEPLRPQNQVMYPDFPRPSTSSDNMWRPW